MNLFSLARAGASLTPGERAFLKLVEGWVIAGALSALVVFLTAVSQPKPDWANMLRISATAFAVATAFAAVKWVKAHLDPPLAAAVDAAAARLGVSDYGNKPALPLSMRVGVPLSTGTGRPVQITSSAAPTHTVVTWTPASPAPGPGEPGHPPAVAVPPEPGNSVLINAGANSLP